MWLWLHVNYRQLFQSWGGWGGGSVSMYNTHMNGGNLAKRLSPNIFLLFAGERGEEGWGRVTGTPKKNKKNTTCTETYTHKTYTLYFELKNRFNYSLQD